MPSIFTSLPEVDKSITRPVVMDIIRQVMDITSIDKSTPIRYKGESEYMIQPRSVMGDKPTPAAILSGSTALTVEVVESYTEDRIGTTAISRIENPPVFCDNNLGVMLRPAYTHNEFEVTFSYRCASRTAALAWRDDIRMSVSHQRDINLHEATYSYGVPHPFLIILYEIYKLREAVDGYGETFDEYILNNATFKFTKGSNLNGEICEWLVGEKQNRILGQFSFTVAPEQIEKGDESGIWVGSFTYKFSFDKPATMHMSYPVMIHNQMLEDKYIPVEPKNLNEVANSFSLSMAAFDYMSLPILTGMYKDYREFVRIPENDNWTYNNLPPCTSIMATMLCSIDDDKRLLLNLNDLGDEFMIPEDVIAFLREGEYRYLTKLYKSVFHLAMFKFNRLAPMDYVLIDNELNVSAKEDLSFRTNHRLALLIVNDLNSIDTNAFKRLKAYPSVLKKFFSLVRCSTGDLNILANRIDLRRMVDAPHGGVSRHSAIMGYTGFNTVMTSGIIARKMTDYPQNERLYHGNCTAETECPEQEGS